MPRAVQIGAGGIGRGFLGQLLFEGGYETVFVDADPTLVASLNVRRSYPLRLVSHLASKTVIIDRISVLNVGQKKEVAQAIGDADLVSIAVGVGNWDGVADVLAAGLRVRGEAPLDILLCENQRHAAVLMRGLLEERWRQPLPPHIGLVETVIGRMVPRTTLAVQTEDPLLLVAEPFSELPIATAHLRGPVPTLPGLILADDFEAYEMRKLYLHNMSHAALAYLGYRRGCEYIWQCAADPNVSAACRRALTAASQALAHCSCFSQGDLEEFSAGLMCRFTNKALGDTVARVAADPIRKLRPGDRLIGAAELCVKTGGDAEALTSVIAAALCYDDPADPAAVKLQDRRRTESGAILLHSLCGLAPDTELSRRVLALL